MDLSPGKLAHELEQRGHAWANADADWAALDDSLKDILSECILDLNDDKLSHAKAEVRARTSPKYREHRDAVASARRTKNLAKVNYDCYQAYIELMRTTEATNRAQMGMR